MSQKKDDCCMMKEPSQVTQRRTSFLYFRFIFRRMGEAINGSFKSPHIHPYSPVTSVPLFPPHNDTPANGLS
jgi:hypothetical protein